MKRFWAFVLTLALILPLLSGCTSQKLSVDYGITDPIAYFFMDRQYALDAEHTDTTEAELETAGQWLTDYVLDSVTTGKCAYDFMIGDSLFSQVLNSWQLDTKSTEDDAKTDWTLTYTQQGQPLTVTVYATAYKQYAVIEWTVWIENTGDEQSQTISEFYGLNQTFASENTGEDITLVTFQGSHQSTESFRPEAWALEAGKSKTVSGTNGKPTVTWASYLNVQWEDEDAQWGKQGVFVSVGWPGQWTATVTNKDGSAEISAKQEKLSTYLLPGEKVRSPLMTLLFWEADIMRSQNLWRRWVYNVAMPQPDGETLPTLLEASAMTDFTEGTTQIQLDAINTWLDNGFDIDLWWIDAGWYERPYDSTAWADTGTWHANAAQYGENLSDIAAVLKENGIGFMLWYEPERVVTGSEFYELKDKGYIIVDRGWHLFNLANDEAAEYLTDFLLDSLKENGATVYRQDANINQPSFRYFWEKASEEGRDGLVENKYIVNYLRMFDAIVEYLPGGFIDTCGSGGSRIDLETTKRAVALWRDDTCHDNLVTQCQSWGINFFMPFSGQGTMDETLETGVYSFRSNLMQSMILHWTLEDNSQELLTQEHALVQEFRDYSEYLVKDYYPLTAFDNSEDGWMAWQYNDPTDTSGIIQVFKRDGSEINTGHYYLSGLEANAEYEIVDIDTGETFIAKGKELMTSGMEVTINEAFAAKFYHYAPVQ